MRFSLLLKVKFEFYAPENPYADTGVNLLPSQIQKTNFLIFGRNKTIKTLDFIIKIKAKMKRMIREIC